MAAIREAAANGALRSTGSTCYRAGHIPRVEVMQRMIPRYSRPEMVAIWSPETKFRIWFEIEAHATTALADLGVVPKEAAEIVWEKGSKATFDVERIDAIEREVKHDVIAFLTHLAEIVGPEARFVHQGMTSSDVLDTCLQRAARPRHATCCCDDMDELLAALKRRAFEHKMTPTIGRSHGIHAEPTTFGLKLALAYAEFERCKLRLIEAQREIATCAISGAVGTFANIDPSVEEYVAEQMGLSVEPVSTQVIPRDRHAMYFATLGVVASSIERLATEIRHLQRSEVLEAEEFFSAGQKGSSAMPHKRNPVLTENLTGLARMVRAYAMPAMENVALWHERDISHSSVERMIGPDATVTLDFALGAPHQRHRQAAGLPGEHAEEPRPPRRPGPLAAGASGADPEGRVPRGRLSAGPAQRHAGLARRRRFPDSPEDRCRRDEVSAPRRDRGLLRPRLPFQACGHDLHAGSSAQAEPIAGGWKISHKTRQSSLSQRSRGLSCCRRSFSPLPSLAPSVAGPLKMITAGGREFTFGDGGEPRVTFRFTDAAAQLALCLHPELKLGELFVDGRLVIERGTIFDLLQLILQDNHGRTRANCRSAACARSAP